MKLDDLVRESYKYESSNIYTSEMKQSQVLQNVIRTGNVKKHQVSWLFKERIKDGLSNIRVANCLEVIAICLIIGLMPILVFSYMKPYNADIANPGYSNSVNNKCSGGFIKGFNEGSGVEKKIEADIDNDGNKEAVVLFKDKKVFVFRNVNSSYINLGEIKASQSLPQDMSINDIEFVKLDNSQRQYIWLSIGNTYDDSYNGHGLIVCSVSKNKIVTDDEEVPGMVENIDIILKSDQSKIYDKVIYSQVNDYEKHCLVQYLKWDGSKFTFDRTEIIYKNGWDKFNYPADPLTVVQCFINAKLLNLQNEVNALTINKDCASFPIEEYFTFNYYDSAKIDILMQSNNKIVYRAYTNSASSSVSELYFALIKSSSNWRIQSISVDKPNY